MICESCNSDDCESLDPGSPYGCPKVEAEAIRVGLIPEQTAATRMTNYSAIYSDPDSRPDLTALRNMPTLGRSDTSEVKGESGYTRVLLRPDGWVDVEIRGYQTRWSHGFSYDAVNPHRVNGFPMRAADDTTVYVAGYQTGPNTVDTSRFTR